MSKLEAELAEIDDQLRITRNVLRQTQADLQLMKKLHASALAEVAKLRKELRRRDSEASHE